MIVKNSYFKLLTDNITLFTLKEFSLEKIESNIKVDALFFHSLIKEVSGVKKVNATNDNKNMSATTLLAAKNREDCQFQHSQRESMGDVHSQHTLSKNNIANKYSSDENSSKGYDNNDSDSYPDVIKKNYHDCR